MKAQKETKWVCIQLICSRRPRALEEAHCWNRQAKFYNENSHEYMKVTKQETLYHENYGANLKHKCGKRIVALPLFIYFIFFWGPSFFLWPFSFLGQRSIEWWSSHFYLFTTQWLQLDTKTKYDSIWMTPVVYRDMQWITSDKYERIMNGGFATNTMSTTWSC